MTWKRALAYCSALTLAVVITACSSAIPGAAPVAPALPGERCADLLAAALTSPDAAVVGAFDCQAPALASNAQGSGIKTDTDIESFAKALGFTSVTDLGGASGAFTYLLKGPNGAEALVIWTDSNGLVSAFEQAHP